MVPVGERAPNDVAEAEQLEPVASHEAAPEVILPESIDASAYSTPIAEKELEGEAFWAPAGKKGKKGKKAKQEREAFPDPSALPVGERPSDDIVEASIESVVPQAKVQEALESWDSPWTSKSQKGKKEQKLKGIEQINSAALEERPAEADPMDFDKATPLEPIEVTGNFEDQIMPVMPPAIQELSTLDDKVKRSSITRPVVEGQDLPNHKADKEDADFWDSVTAKKPNKGKRGTKAEQLRNQPLQAQVGESEPTNRDSAVHVFDSPLLADRSPVQAMVRDSGFHDSLSENLASPEAPLFSPAATSENPLEVEYLLGQAISPDLLPEYLSGGQLSPVQPDNPSVPLVSQGSDDYLDRPGPTTITVEADPAYEVSVAQTMDDIIDSTSGSAESFSGPRMDPHDRAIHQNDEQGPSNYLSRSGATLPISIEAMPELAIISTTTKDRDSVLFKSSPMNQSQVAGSPVYSHPDDDVPERTQRHREEQGWRDEVKQAQRQEQQAATVLGSPPTLQGSTHPVGLKDHIPEIALVSSPASHEPDDRMLHSSIFGGPVGINSDVDIPVEERLASPSTQSRRLDPIAEHDMEESPLARKSRAISSRGSSRAPSTLSNRLVLTPDSTREHHQQSSLYPYAAGTDRREEDQSAERGKRLISTDDLISRLSWPSVDDKAETVDIERVKSRDSQQHSSDQAANASALTPEVARNPPVDRQSPNDQCVEYRTNVNLSRRITPEREFFRPGSGLSQRSSGTPPLRRVDRRVSGDLRAANRREESRLANDRALNLTLDRPQLSTTRPDEPIRDSARGGVGEMAAVYVSAAQCFHRVPCANDGFLAGGMGRRSRFTAITRQTAKRTTTAEHATDHRS